jgi:hypothetical protein
MVSDGVVSAPVEEIEVVPVPPNAAVFAEIAVVDEASKVVELGELLAALGF